MKSIPNLPCPLHVTAFLSKSLSSNGLSEPRSPSGDQPLLSSLPSNHLPATPASPIVHILNPLGTALQAQIEDHPCKEKNIIIKSSTSVNT